MLHMKVTGTFYAVQQYLHLISISVPVDICIAVLPHFSKAEITKSWKDSGDSLMYSRPLWALTLWQFTVRGSGRRE